MSHFTALKVLAALVVLIGMTLIGFAIYRSQKKRPPLPQDTDIGFYTEDGDKKKRR